MTRARRHASPPLARLADTRGTALLEFTALLPVFAVILMVILELSRAWFTLNIVTTAAREGVRAASVVDASSVSSVGVARINAVLGSAGMSCASGTCPVTCVSGPCAGDSQIQAAVTVPFQTVVPLILPTLSSINVAQTATMRWEGP